MNYYIFLSYNFREIDNAIFSLDFKSFNVIVIYVFPQDSCLRKNILLYEVWSCFADKLLSIGISCYEFKGSNTDLLLLIEKIKKEDNKNIVLQDTIALLFSSISKEYKLCRPFLNYHIKNSIIEITHSELFFEKKYNNYQINFLYKGLYIFEKKKIADEKKINIEKLWTQIITSDLIPNYGNKRDYLDQEYTSNFSRFINTGQISVRKMWHDVKKKYGHLEGGKKFLSELGWRDFAYHQFNYHPDMLWKNLNGNAKVKYTNNYHALDAWKNGCTGIGIIDAGMKQLKKTGWIPNRIRMLTASYLTKNLFISWQTGAEYFLEQLIDADPVINALNWQWVAGTGTDYMPQFRIFNPVLQAKKYDKDGIYQKKWNT